MIVDGKVRMYFGPFPAFLRIPLNFVYPAGHGKWSRVSGFCAGIIALCAFAGLMRIALRFSPLSLRARNWVGNACIVGFALGSPLLLLLGNLSIYDEAIIWGLSWSLAALYFALRSRQVENNALTRSLLGFSLCAAGALLSRVTFGIPFILIALLLALRLPRENRITNLLALLLPIGAAFAFYIWLSYARFGSFVGVNCDYYVNPVHNEFVHKYGLFSPRRIPYSLADYFSLRFPSIERQPPFLVADRHSYNYPSLFPTLTARYTSLSCGRPAGWSLPPLWESHVCFAAKDSTSLREGRPWLYLLNLFASYRISCSPNVTPPISILS